MLCIQYSGSTFSRPIAPPTAPRHHKGDFFNESYRKNNFDQLQFK